MNTNLSVIITHVDMSGAQEHQPYRKYYKCRYEWCSRKTNLSVSITYIDMSGSPGKLTLS